MPPDEDWRVVTPDDVPRVVTPDVPRVVTPPERVVTPPEVRYPPLREVAVLVRPVVEVPTRVPRLPSLLRGEMPLRPPSGLLNERVRPLRLPAVPTRPPLLRQP